MGFNGIRTRDLRVAGALLYQLSYEATHWEQGQFMTINKWIKLSEAILNILGGCWKKGICTTLPASLMEEFPAGKVHLQPATWLTGKFPRRRMSRHHRPVGSGHRAKLSPSVGRGGEGFRQTAHSSYLSAILQRAYYFFQIFQPKKNCLQNRYFEEQIHWVPLTSVQVQCEQLASDLCVCFRCRWVHRASRLWRHQWQLYQYPWFLLLFLQSWFHWRWKELYWWDEYKYSSAKIIIFLPWT